MSAINDGGPAFPYGQKNITERSSEGMTLRDYFAGQALAGMQIDHDGALCAADHKDGSSKLFAKWRAAAAYRYADAMIAAREAKP